MIGPLIPSGFRSFWWLWVQLETESLIPWVNRLVFLFLILFLMDSEIERAFEYWATSGISKSRIFEKYKFCLKSVLIWPKRSRTSVDIQDLSPRICCLLRNLIKIFVMDNGYEVIFKKKAKVDLEFPLWAKPWIRTFLFHSWSSRSLSMQMLLTIKS